MSQCNRSETKVPFLGVVVVVVVVVSVVTSSQNYADIILPRLFETSIRGRHHKESSTYPRRLPLPFLTHKPTPLQ
jgi:hypothetical protein